MPNRTTPHYNRLTYHLFGITNPWLKVDDCKSSPAAANVEHIRMSQAIYFICSGKIYEILRYGNYLV